VRLKGEPTDLVELIWPGRAHGQAIAHARGDITRPFHAAAATLAATFDSTQHSQGPPERAVATIGGRRPNARFPFGRDEGDE
ncbi:MAG: hypothetical protein ACRDTZ_23840, partial [Pseudonocardiaceae bacterium]